MVEYCCGGAHGEGALRSLGERGLVAHGDEGVQCEQTELLTACMNALAKNSPETEMKRPELLQIQEM